MLISPHVTMKVISAMVRLFFSALLGCALFGCSIGTAQNPPPTASPTASPGATTSPTPAKSEYSETTPASLPKIGYSSVHVDGPYIALTFDDGPDPVNTPKLLDLLAQKHIKATFFVLGECASAHPDILKRIIAEGHEIGNHSWSHPNFAKMSNEAVAGQLQRTQDVIKAATGFTPKLMRPPYGSVTDKQRHWLHDDLGFKVIMWSVDPYDWKRPGPAVVTRRIVSETRNGAIILSHDIHAPTIEAMPATFDELLEKGFKPVTVSELLALETAPTPTPTASPDATAAESPKKKANRKNGN